MFLLICQFLYDPLIWISKNLLHKVCKVGFRTFQTIYNVYNKSYEEILSFNHDVSVHPKQLCILAI